MTKGIELAGDGEPDLSLLQLDLNDAAVRNVLRTGCILLEYYQGAF